MTAPSKTLIEGDWIVLNDAGWGGYDYRVCRVIKVTKEKVIASDEGRSQERHFHKKRVLFFGSERSARRVCEKSKSSAARHDAARLQVRQQHEMRVLAIINAAEHYE